MVLTPAVKVLFGGPGTLQHVSLAGGAARELLDDVLAADWTPDGTGLAVVRSAQVEFPLGTRIYGENRFRYVRVSPDGQRLALVEGPGLDAQGRRQGTAIVVLDRSGRKTTLSSGWGDYATLAWSPSGDEVWFTANRPEDLKSSQLRAVSIDGRERGILPTAGRFLSIHDVSPDGRALISSFVSRMGCSCQTSHDTQPRDLGWLDGPAPEALSSDGRFVLMAEVLRGRGAAGSIYLRGTDGSDAIRLGDGFPEDLSPNGKWVLATSVDTRAHWFLLPTGTGASRPLPAGPLVQRFEANFLPDGRRIVFGGRAKDRRRQIFVQDVEGGLPRAISPENAFTAGLSTPDGRFVVGAIAGARQFLFPVDGGAPVPLTATAPGDLPLQWSDDGRMLYVRRARAWPPVVDRITISNGHRETWKTIKPADPVGVDTVERILVTPDGKTYCHDYIRLLSDLFVVEGLI
jgi:dipeptidyl aminopeptidase/acylaminoacyl peptidase